MADVKEVEVELQPAGRLREGRQTALVAPAARYNYGFAERWEFLLEGQIETPLSPTGPSSLVAADAILKYVIQPGVLQDKSGPSIATEFGPLLPGINADAGVGFSWAGIVSQRWDWGTVHFTVETALIEGPSKWKIRPVAEVFVDEVVGQSRTVSSLVGAIWQVRDNLSFDAGFRLAAVNGHPVEEIRAGMTFSFAVPDL